MKYSSYLKQPGQMEPIKGLDMVRNHGNGYVFEASPWDKLDRFLIMGTEGGTYYASEQTVTYGSIDNLRYCIKNNGKRVVERIVELSTSGRAAKTEPSLFALALCSAASEPDTRKRALSKLGDVARTGTHLFYYLSCVRTMRGWGRGIRTAFANWYENKRDLADLVYQLVKYKNRNGWTHRDALRLAHVEAASSDENRKLIYQRVKGRIPELPPSISAREIAFARYEAAEKVARTLDADEAVFLIRAHNLPFEVVNTALLKKPAIWEALLEKMPMTAMIRNLGRMTSIGLVSPGSKASKEISQRLTNETFLRKARIHPVAVLNALNTYSNGYGLKGNLNWVPDPEIIQALNDAFYLSFGNIPMTGKRLLLAIDVSGSMGSAVLGMPNMSASALAAAMAMVTARREPYHLIRGFSTSKTGWASVLNNQTSDMGGFIDLRISPNDSLQSVLKKLSLPFGATDCALPMLWALQNRVAVDAFVIYTDSETFCGNVHPCIALDRYRQATGIPAKLIVSASAVNDFTVANPSDKGMLDIVGFDAATPQIMADFILEEVEMAGR